MKYYADVSNRYKVQTGVFLIQLAVAELLNIFTVAWLGTILRPAGDAMYVLMFTFFGLYLAVYAAQLIFASVTYKKIEQKSKRDAVFLVFSIIVPAFEFVLWRVHPYVLNLFV